MAWRSKAKTHRLTCPVRPDHSRESVWYGSHRRCVENGASCDELHGVVALREQVVDIAQLLQWGLLAPGGAPGCSVASRVAARRPAMRRPLSWAWSKAFW
jgi:hypothetical protein